MYIYLVLYQGIIDYLLTSACHRSNEVASANNEDFIEINVLQKALRIIIHA